MFVAWLGFGDVVSWLDNVTNFLSISSIDLRSSDTAITSLNLFKKFFLLLAGAIGIFGL